MILYQIYCTYSLSGHNNSITTVKDEWGHAIAPCSEMIHMRFETPLITDQATSQVGHRNFCPALHTL